MAVWCAVIAYDPADPLQKRFLDAIAKGEGNAGYDQGFGYRDLSGFPRDKWGFPVWPGVRTRGGMTHAAGPYQFEPGTWLGVAVMHSLDFRNDADQDAGAWYLAQELVPDLHDKLSVGQWIAVGLALQSTWTGGWKEVAAQH